MTTMTSSLGWPHPHKLVPERELGGGFGPAIPWKERPFNELDTTQEIVGGSRARLYKLNAEGKLKFARVAGRTMVETESIIRLIREAKAKPWVPSDKNRAALAQRARNAAAKITKLQEQSNTPGARLAAARKSTTQRKLVTQ